MRNDPAQSAASAKEILKARARALAGRPSGAEAAGETLTVIEFRLAKERYAVEQHLVREVCPLKELTAVPCTPAFVLGVINVRGQVLPVIDLKKFFDLPETGITDMHMVVIVHCGDVEVGILADVVVGTRSIAAATLQNSLPTLTGIRAEYLKGIGEGNTVILDAARILADPRIVVDEQVDS